MSQEKVSRYKEEKAKRKDILKKQRFKNLLYKACAGAICLAIVGWIGFSVYQNNHEAKEKKKNAVAAEINLDAINEYTSGLTAQQ
ncbi:hypothetical protein [Anaerosacchariphilus polymeriproducens]|uniref:Uncharacterized protein n=1 Tax=Anaerosacchariphilus polymeriproducens TaxID=1812858 RepID=A0A371AR51_9FIRM|nr:hypothetical protein [Anaerosacchariphilus polymeriproducens]RDU22053.1 hypothetical protein DWV06_16095 [Anaerosacchariphilus polymeriproducens]